MSAEITGLHDGILTVRIDGRLAEADLATLAAATLAAVPDRDRVRILVETDGFAGWDQDADWSDFSFQEQLDPRIARMAIIGESRWQDLALLFTAAGLRSFPIRYFLPEQVDAARRWVAGDD